MSIANTAQAEHWNTGEAVAHWVDNQARYGRMNAPFGTCGLQQAAARQLGHWLAPSGLRRTNTATHTRLRE
jgi:hypothetical protein